MDFVPTEEQRGLTRELRRSLERAWPADRRRAAFELPGAVDRGLWRTLGELGVFDLLREGDDGWGMAGAVLAAEEVGRAAVSGPIVGTMLAVGRGVAPPTAVVGLVAADPPVLIEHFDALDALVVLPAAPGDRRGPAHDDAAPGDGPAPGELTAEGRPATAFAPAARQVVAGSPPAGPTAAGPTTAGPTTAGPTTAGAPAPGTCAALAPDLTAGADQAMLIEPGTLPTRPVPRPLDPLTPVAVCTAPLPAGEPVGRAAEWRTDAALLTAAVQVGLAAAALDMAVDYAKVRHQFGRPIGGFQALGHLLADVHVAVETARAAVQAAAVGADEGAVGARLTRAVAGARVLASRAADTSTRGCVQVHGGIGYTWELDAHLYLKRALVLDTAPGTVEEAYGALSGALEAPAIR